jgi:hypothetical protein
VRHPALPHKTPARNVPGASTWVPVCTLSSFSSDKLAWSPRLMLNTGAVIRPSPSSPSQMGRSSRSVWVMSRIFLEFLATAAAAADAPHCCRSAWHRRTSEDWDQSSALVILAGCGKSIASVSICKARPIIFWRQFLPNGITMPTAAFAKHVRSSFGDNSCQTELQCQQPHLQSTSDHLLETIPAKRNYNANSRTIEGDKHTHTPTLRLRIPSRIFAEQYIQYACLV